LSLTTVLLLRPKIAHNRRIATTAIAARPQPVSQNVVVVAGCVVVTSVADVVVCEDVPTVASVGAGAACVFADAFGVAGCAAGAD
jgi:serine acetyltransferase